MCGGMLRPRGSLCPRGREGGKGHQRTVSGLGTVVRSSFTLFIFQCFDRYMRLLPVLPFFWDHKRFAFFNVQARSSIPSEWLVDITQGRPAQGLCTDNDTDALISLLKAVLRLVLVTRRHSQADHCGGPSIPAVSSLILSQITSLVCMYTIPPPPFLSLNPLAFFLCLRL